MALSAGSVYEEIVDPMAKGETLSAGLDSLLKKAGATLDDVKRVMVTLGPGSFSGLRTGVAFCQGLSFSGKRDLYGVTTLQALECFGLSEEQGQTPQATAVVIRARTGFWYLRLDGEEKFIETPEVIELLEKAQAKVIVADDAALADDALKATFEKLGARTVRDTGIPLSCWSTLFDTVKPSLIQEANYIQPSYFEKLKA